MNNYWLIFCWIQHPNKMLADFPPEIILHIFQNFQLKELWRLMNVCSQWQCLIKQSKWNKPLPIEITIKIFQHLRLKELVKIEAVCRQWHELIRMYPWDHDIMVMFNIPKKNCGKIIKIYDKQTIQHILTKYNFQNFSFDMAKLNEELFLDLINMKPCQSVVLRFRKEINDDIVSQFKWLKHCKHVDFSNTSVTDAILPLLSHCQSVRLYDSKITDAGLPYLRKCRVVDLTKCQEITDDGLIHLSNCHTIYLSRCGKITDKGIRHLINCHKVDISGCNVSDELTNELKTKIDWILFEKPIQKINKTGRKRINNGIDVD